MLETVRAKHNFPALAAAVVVDGNFYDGTSLATALHFNAASSPAWDWKRPIDGQRVIGLNEPGLIWQDGAVSAFRTTIPVPEPSAAGTCWSQQRSEWDENVVRARAIPTRAHPRE